jgi:HSP20 family protein
MLMRFDPFREVDRLTETMLERPSGPRMPMDAYRHGDSFLIHFDLPGIDPASIE